MYYESQNYQEWQAQRPEHIAPGSFGGGDYWSFTGTGLPSPIGFLGFKIILDDYGTIFVNLHSGNMPGGSITRGYLFIEDSTQPFNKMVPVENFPKGQQKEIMQDAMVGTSGSFGGSAYLLTGNIGISGGSQAHTTQEGGIAAPGFALTADVGYTFQVFPRP